MDTSCGMLRKPRAASYVTETCPPYSSTSSQILTACRIAKRYSHRLPTVQELRQDFGMSRATAFRWLSALKQA